MTVLAKQKWALLAALSLVSAFLLAACDDASQSEEPLSTPSQPAVTATATPTPTTTPATTSSTAFVPTPTEALARPCAGIANAEYDQIRVVRRSDGSRQELNYRYSGGDYHVETVVYDSDGLLELRADAIWKEETYYYRGSADLETPNTITQWMVLDSDLDFSLPVPNGCAGEASAVNSDNGDSRSETNTNLRHLIWEAEASSLTDRTMWEMWVDSNGRPVRGLVTVYHVPQESEVPGASGQPEGVRTPEVEYTIEETYSGFGEPNTITAPITPPTPTPTPRSSPILISTPSAAQRESPELRSM